MENQILTLRERKDLRGLLDSGNPIVMQMQGESQDREVRFRVEGTREEVRIPYPNAE